MPQSIYPHLFGSVLFFRPSLALSPSKQTYFVGLLFARDCCLLKTACNLIHFLDLSIKRMEYDNVLPPNFDLSIDGPDIVLLEPKFALSIDGPDVVLLGPT